MLLGALGIGVSFPIALAFLCGAAASGALPIAPALEEKGPRPEPTVPGLEAERDALLSHLDALRIVIAQFLEEKAADVERHRKRLIRDADAETATLQARYSALVGELASVREELIAARQATIWAAATEPRLDRDRPDRKSSPA